MDKIEVMLLILHFMVFEKNVSSLTLKTEDVVFISKEDKDMILNCTYQNDTKDVISNKYIRWRIMVKDVFKDLAIFSPPGGLNPSIEESMEDLYTNRTELIAPTISQLSAVMIIKDPVCTDEGTYQCWIQYTVGISSTKNVVESANTSVQFNGTAEAREPTEFLVHPSELEENQSISLTCNADVGRPRGNIQIWKILNTSELIDTSNSTEKENCMDYVNVIFPVTRDDNGAVFRCLSQNNFTQDSGPSRDWSKITVIYGPDKPTITLTPRKTMYSVGDSLTIKCYTVSNPPSVFTWSFQSYNKSEKMPIEHSNNKTKLMFKSVQTKDAGTYTCTVINMARPSYPNMSCVVSINVNKLEGIQSVCDQCGYFKTCQQDSEKTVCKFDKWVAVALVFISLSTAFAISSIVLIMQRNKSKETNKKIVDKRCPSDATPEDNHGGYISPENLEFGSLQSSATQDSNSVAYSRL